MGTKLRTEPRRSLKGASDFQLSYAAPYLSYASLYQATPHPTELCTLHLSELLCILWAKLHSIWATPHSTKLRPTQLSYVRCTFLSYYAFSELRCTVSELRLILPSYAPPNWAMYAAPFWANMHSLSYAAPYLSYASLYQATPHPTELCTLHLSELPYTLWATLHRSWAVSNQHSYNCLKCRNAGRWHTYVM